MERSTPTATLRVQRAGQVASDFFMILRRASFDKKVRKVEEKAGCLDIEIESLEDDVVACAYNDTLNLNKRDEVAVLSHLACEDAVKYVGPLVRRLLPDLASNIREITIQIADCSRETCSTFTDNSSHSQRAMAFKHVFWSIHLPHEECYIMDLSSAQYGHDLPVTLKEEYEKTILASEDSRPTIRYSGYLINQERNFCHLLSEPFERARVKMMSILIKALDEALEQWEQAHMKLAEMLYLPRHQFEIQAQQFNNYATSFIHREFDKLHAPGGLLAKTGGLSVIADHMLSEFGLNAELRKQMRGPLQQYEQGSVGGEAGDSEGSTEEHKDLTTALGNTRLD